MISHLIAGPQYEEEIYRSLFLPLLFSGSTSLAIQPLLSAYLSHHSSQARPSTLLIIQAPHPIPTTSLHSSFVLFFLLLSSFKLSFYFCHRSIRSFCFCHHFMLFLVGGVIGRRPLTQKCQAWRPQLLPRAGQFQSLMVLGKNEALLYCVFAVTELELLAVTSAVVRGENLKRKEKKKETFF